MTIEPDLAEHLRLLEAEFLSPAVRQSRAALEALVTPDFVEFGSTGGTYDRTSVVDALLGQMPPAIRLVDFTVRELAPGVALVTYRSVIDRPGGEPPSTALRSSVWCRQDDGLWRMTFHQGTPTR